MLLAVPDWQRAAMAKLVIQSDNGSKEVIRLRSGLNRIGRSSVNDFMIPHPSVSRFHCEIEVKEEGLFVRDLDSSNGTFVDGNVITYGRLDDGQTLQLGDVCMLVEDAPASVVAEIPPCYNHASHPASMQCRQCHKVFCGACVHILRSTDGFVLRLCPVCSGYCDPLKK
jgi:predicted component of type VI protein secretion system